MKKIFALFLGFCLLFCGCADDYAVVTVITTNEEKTLGDYLDFEPSDVVKLTRNQFTSGPTLAESEATLEGDEAASAAAALAAVPAKDFDPDSVGQGMTTIRYTLTFSDDSTLIFCEDNCIFFDDSIPPLNGNDGVEFVCDIEGNYEIPEFADAKSIWFDHIDGVRTPRK